MEQRILMFDHVKATGLNPNEVSRHSSPVQIFSPGSHAYLQVSNSSAKKPEEDSKFVGIDDDYRGGNKRFLLEKIADNEFHVKSVENDTDECNGYLYVSDNTASGLIESSSNVLRSAKIAFKEDLYVFRFVRHHEQNGIYKIICKANGKVLFASDKQLKADHRDREKSNKIWFQLSFKPHKDISVSNVEDGCHIFRSCEESPAYIDEVYNASKYDFKQGFEEGIAQLSSYMEKLRLKEREALKADTRLNPRLGNMSPIEIGQGKKMMMTSSEIQNEVKEKKLLIEWKGSKFEGYTVSSTSTKVVHISPGNKEERQ